jgi:hypothetical protein
MVNKKYGEVFERFGSVVKVYKVCLKGNTPSG